MFFLINVSWSDGNGRGWRGRSERAPSPLPHGARPAEMRPRVSASLSGSLWSEGNANEDNKDRALSLVTLTKIQTADKIESRLGCGELATLGRAGGRGRASGGLLEGGSAASVSVYAFLRHHVPSSASASPPLPQPPLWKRHTQPHAPTRHPPIREVIKLGALASLPHLGQNPASKPCAPYGAVQAKPGEF